MAIYKCSTCKASKIRHKSLYGLPYCTDGTRIDTKQTPFCWEENKPHSMTLKGLPYPVRLNLYKASNALRDQKE
jgi:hypothetical protein